MSDNELIKRSKDVNSNILQNILEGRKTPHSTSQPLIYKEGDNFFLAVFVFFYTREDIASGAVDRPTMWAIADISTGEILKRFETKEKDFSQAPYDVKYNVRSDAEYDTSAQYYEKAFAILDSVRTKIINEGKFDENEYQQYLSMILANIPKDYQRFYTDLSV